MEPKELRGNEVELGGVRSRHECRNLEGWVVAAVVPLVVGLAGFAAGGLPPVAVVGVSTSLLLWVGATTWWTPRFVLVLDHGLEVHRRLRAPERLEFSQITGASWDFQVHTSAFGTAVAASDLVLHAGNRRVRLNTRHFKDPETFFTRVWRLCVYPGHTALLEKFASGAEVGFGDLSASPTHLRIGEQQWPWSEVAKAEISPRLIILHFKGRSWRRSLSLRKIPYAFTFVELLRKLRVPLSAFDGFVIRN